MQNINNLTRSLLFNFDRWDIKVVCTDVLFRKPNNSWKQQRPLPLVIALVPLESFKYKFTIEVHLTEEKAALLPLPFLETKCVLFDKRYFVFNFS